MKKIIKTLIALILISPILIIIILGSAMFGKNGFSFLWATNCLDKVFNFWAVGFIVPIFVVGIIILPVVVYESIKDFSSTIRGLAKFYFLISTFLFAKFFFEVVSQKFHLNFFIENFCSSQNLDQAIRGFCFFGIAFFVFITVGTLTHKFFFK